ncbi:MAG: carbamoylphosphate synthase large subunit [Parasporobacterium sp.]|nr:carbamoylphosphate synthase large subunit [Parasporobacterium sp.]MBQ9032971.1 carbamoylphosphate synthase large subunit [Parasporobacterium sp.]
MNFIFISPYFPHTYWQFCNRLRRNGVNVLGIGDASYDSLEQSLKESLTEYYRVDSLENYDEVYRAVAYFAFHYGKPDWLESNNEYWLEQDARLRTDFHITTGIQADEISSWKHKSGMKPVYQKAKIPTARCHAVSTITAARKFIRENGGYPVIAKPDVGVGASNTWKLENDADLSAFFQEKPEVPYLIEEFVEGDIFSYDAVVDSQCKPLFESMTAWPPSIADIVNHDLDLAYYVAAAVPAPLRKLGRAALKAFNVRSRFVHLEFFRLTKARKGLGEVGDYVALEVNMRPAGGYTPDMMNFAHSTDVYQIWADMVTADQRLLPDSKDHHWCVYAGRKDWFEYVHTHEEILEKYGSRIVMCERMPELMWATMGNQMYTAHAASEEDALEFIRFIQERR